MTALATTSTYDLLIESLSAIKANLTLMQSTVSTIRADLSSLSTAVAYNQAQLALYNDQALSVKSQIIEKRAVVDGLATSIQNSIDNLNALIADSNNSGTTTTYKSVIAELNSLRDLCVSFYDLYDSIALKISNSEDTGIISHIIQGWGTAHGGITQLSNAYTDSADNLVGDAILKIPCKDNSVSYNFTTKDEAAGATASILYVPGSSVALPVTNAKIYERCTSPYSPNGTAINWVLYLPPEVHSGVFQKYAFIQCGSTGMQRWQYQNASGAWITIADLSVTGNVNYYAAYSGTQTFTMPAQDSSSTATVTYSISISRTAHGGCMRIEPVGPMYPPANKVYFSGLRVLIMNTASTTCHRTVVATIGDRDALTPSLNQRVFVSSNSTQYYWNGASWQQSPSTDTVDQINFSGLGIYRKYCEYQ